MCNIFLLQKRVKINKKYKEMKSEYQVKFSSWTGNCKLIRNNQTIKSFHTTSKLLEYLEKEKIEIAIGDCICE